jgi:hypothetical protein
MIVLLAASAPHPLTDELSLLGHQVQEAVAVSEVFNLMERNPSRDNNYYSRH